MSTPSTPPRPGASASRRRRRRRPAAAQAAPSIPTASGSPTPGTDRVSAQPPRPPKRPRSDHRGERPARRTASTPPARSAAQSPRRSTPVTASTLEITAAPASEATSDAGFAQLGVPADLVEVLHAAGITSPFPIQQATLPDALAGRDILGQGRTGSGKTLAFCLPMVANLASRPVAEPSRRSPRALVLVPTRELANQVHATLSPLTAPTALRSTTVFGGVSPAPQIKALAAGTEIVVACPGRLLDHLSEGHVDLSRVEIVVIDEADHMADQGFLPMVRKILDACTSASQHLLFSATLQGGVDVLVKRYMNNPVEHNAGVEHPVLLDHHVKVIDGEHRVQIVADLAGDSRTVVFCRTKHRAKQLARKLCALGVSAVELHGNLSQNARERNLAAFAAGTATALVATDIAARGIHVDEVPLVIHADPPVEHKAYVHRSGRTARAGASGTVVTLAAPDQISEVKGLLKKAQVDATWDTM